MRIETRPTLYQAPLFEESFYECDIYGGRGRGGSHGITLHALDEMITTPYFRGYLVRAIHGHIRDSLWQDFIDRIDEVSDLNNYDLKKDFILRENNMSAIYKPNGNQLKSKGFKASTKSNTAHMKSIAGATHIYIEECEEVGEEEYNKLADSLRTTKGDIKIIRSWNPPPKEHWLVKNYYNTLDAPIDGYYTLEPKGIPRHISIFGTFENNIKNLDSNTIARYRRYEETSKRYYYTQIKGYVSDGGDNKVYNNWKSIPLNEYLALDYPAMYGLDVGDVSPNAFGEVKYNDGNFFTHEMLYKSTRALKAENPNPEKGVLIDKLEMMGVDKAQEISVDGAAKSTITELRQAGYNARKSDKSAGSVANGIEFINKANNYYTDTSINLENEYNSYYLEVDQYKVPIDGKPVKGNDHCFAGETLIRTEHGKVRIDEIRKGQKVWTSKGLKEVIATWNNGSKEILEYKLNTSNGVFRLKCTPDHKIKTNKGWLKISKLKQGMTVSLYNITEEENLNSNMENATSIVEKPKCIGMSGNPITSRQDPKDFISTIKTETATITGRRTWFWSRLAHTFSNMQRKDHGKTLNGLTISSQRGLRVQKSGTNPQKESNGTKSRLRSLILANRTMVKWIAAYVEKRQLKGTRRNYSAVTHVNQNGEGIQESTMKKESAQSVVLNSKQTSIQKRSTAVESAVLKVEQEVLNIENVYDLTIKDDHEYFANDLLVHNCMDMDRYAKYRMKRRYKIVL